jgi:hypothetical protein
MCLLYLPQSSPPKTVAPATTSAAPTSTSTPVNAVHVDVTSSSAVEPVKLEGQGSSTGGLGSTASAEDQESLARGLESKSSVEKAPAAVVAGGDSGGTIPGGVQQQLVSASTGRLMSVQDILSFVMNQHCC